MLVNRDQENSHKVRIVFDGDGNSGYFTGELKVANFGSAQYQWHPTDTGGFPEPDGPVVKSTVMASADTWFELPKASMTIIRGLTASPSGRSKAH